MVQVVICIFGVSLLPMHPSPLLILHNGNPPLHLDIHSIRLDPSIKRSINGTCPIAIFPLTFQILLQIQCSRNGSLFRFLPPTQCKFSMGCNGWCESMRRIYNSRGQCELLFLWIRFQLCCQAVILVIVCYEKRGCGSV